MLVVGEMTTQRRQEQDLNQQQDLAGHKLNTTNYGTNKCRGYGMEGSRKGKKRVWLWTVG
jgi:hypothetical protein